MGYPVALCTLHFVLLRFALHMLHFALAMCSVVLPRQFVITFLHAHSTSGFALEFGKRTFGAVPRSFWVRTIAVSSDDRARSEACFGTCAIQTLAAPAPSLLPWLGRKSV